MDSNYLIVQPVELGGVARPGLLLKDVYRIYAGRFRRWFAITAPTSLLASAVLFMADQKIIEIYRSFPITQISHHTAEVAKAYALRYGSFFSTWFLGCFALAAIATVVNGLNKSEKDDVWISDSFQRARERIWPLLLVAIATFALYLVGMALVLFIILATSRVVGWVRFSRLNLYAGFAGVVVISIIVSWFAMAIPLVLAEDIGAWAALRKSLKLSNGYEGFLSLLVCESLVGSCSAWYAVHYGLTFVFPLQFRYTAWYGWLVYGGAILASAAVQPPMFIGFSLLAADECSDSLAPPVAQQSSHID